MTKDEFQTQVKQLSVDLERMVAEGKSDQERIDFANTEMKRIMAQADGKLS